MDFVVGCVVSADISILWYVVTFRGILHIIVAVTVSRKHMAMIVM